MPNLRICRGLFVIHSIHQAPNLLLKEKALKQRIDSSTRSGYMTYNSKLVIDGQGDKGLERRVRIVQQYLAMGVPQYFLTGRLMSIAADGKRNFTAEC